MTNRISLSTHTEKPSCNQKSIIFSSFHPSPKYIAILAFGCIYVNRFCITLICLRKNQDTIPKSPWQQGTILSGLWQGIDLTQASLQTQLYHRALFEISGISTVLLYFLSLVLSSDSCCNLLLDWWTGGTRGTGPRCPLCLL